MSFFKTQGMHLHFGNEFKSGVPSVAGVPAVKTGELQKPSGTRAHPAPASHQENHQTEKTTQTLWNSRLIWERIQRGERVRVWSKVLGEWVLWVRDEAVRALARREHPEFVSYTVSEIEHLIGMKSEEALRAVHQTKKIFGSDTRITDSAKT